VRAAAGAVQPPGLEAGPTLCGPTQSALAGMAALLTSGPLPDEQDFIQAYEEVREKYKGTAPPVPARPPWRSGRARSASLTAGR
jgi:hypothetical protein